MHRFTAGIIRRCIFFEYSTTFLSPPGSLGDASSSNLQQPFLHRRCHSAMHLLRIFNNLFFTVGVIRRCIFFESSITFSSPPGSFGDASPSNLQQPFLHRRDHSAMRSIPYRNRTTHIHLYITSQENMVITSSFNRCAILPFCPHIPHSVLGTNRAFSQCPSPGLPLRSATAYIYTYHQFVSGKGRRRRGNFPRALWV